VTERKTPYFIPRTAPPTKEGVEQLRREFYAAVAARTRAKRKENGDKGSRAR
jgi:hypothetical protein